MIIKVILDKRKANKEGKYPIKFRFANNGKTAYLFLNMYASDAEFDSENGIYLLTDKNTKTRYSNYNSIIIAEFNKVNDLILDLRKKGQANILPTKFKELYLSQGIDTNNTFNKIFKEFIESKQGSTAEIYQATLNKIDRYYKQDLQFEEVNYSFLKNFESLLKVEEIKDSAGKILRCGLSTNARGIHFRNIRAVFNYAINSEIIDQGTYPFRRFKIATEKTKKRSLALDQIRKLFSFEGEEHLNWARDISKLIFFLIGINIKDLYELSDYSLDYVDYKRAKTKTLYSIKIEPETKELLDKFKGRDSLLCFKETMGYKSFGVRINKHLRVIGESIGVEKLTSYFIRHTWATIAAELDIPKETIAAALGHSQNSMTTDIYIDFNKKKIDDANRKVMDYVLNKDLH